MADFKEVYTAEQEEASLEDQLMDYDEFSTDIEIEHTIKSEENESLPSLEDLIESENVLKENESYDDVNNDDFSTEMSDNPEIDNVIKSDEGCPEKRFSKRHRLKTNKKTKPVNLSCGQCDYTAAKTYFLKIHKENKHGKGEYPCDQCEYVGKADRLLSRHKESKHESIRYICELCEFTTVYNFFLKKHIKLKHQDQNAIDNSEFGDIDATKYLKLQDSDDTEKFYVLKDGIRIICSEVYIYLFLTFQYPHSQGYYYYYYCCCCCCLYHQ